MSLVSIDATIKCDVCGKTITIPEVSEDHRHSYNYHVVIDTGILKELVIGLNWVTTAMVKHACPTCAYGGENHGS